MEEHAFRFSNYDICALTGTECRAGIQFLEQLKHNITAADSVLEDNFELCGQVSLTGCNYNCTAAFQCNKKAICFLGDVDPKADAEVLFSEIDSKQASINPALLSSKTPSTFMRLERQTLHH